MEKILFTSEKFNTEQLCTVALDGFKNDSARALNPILMEAHPEAVVREEQCRQIVAGWLMAGATHTGLGHVYGTCLAVYGTFPVHLRSWMLAHHLGQRSQVGREIHFWIYEPANLEHTPIDWLLTGLYAFSLDDLLKSDFDGPLPEPASLPPHVKFECIQLILEDGGRYVVPRTHLNDSVNGELEGLIPAGPTVTLEFKLLMMSQNELDGLPEFEG